MPDRPREVFTSHIEEFVDLVDREFVRDRPESFWRLEQPFGQLAASAFLEATVNAELQKLLQDPAYMGDWRPNQLLLHRGRGFALSVWLFEKPRQYVHTMPFYGMYAPMGKNPLRYTRYALPATYCNEVFDPRIRISAVGSGEVRPGEIIKLESERYAYDFHIETPVPVIKLTTAPFQSMEWLFDKATGLAWQANDSVLTATQLRVAAYILGKLGHPTSAEPLGRLTRHAHHSVRWAAVQGLGRVDGRAAVEELGLALSDSHPHVRRAAASTLLQLNGRQ